MGDVTEPHQPAAHDSKLPAKGSDLHLHGINGAQLAGGSALHGR